MQGEACVRLVAVDGEHLGNCAESDQVTADAAAQVGDAGGGAATDGVGKAGGAVAGDRFR